MLGRRLVPHVAGRLWECEINSAAPSRSYQTLELLSIRRQDRWGDIPLHKAAHNGHLAVAETLLNYLPGSGTTANGEGKTPRDLASDGGMCRVRACIYDGCLLCAGCVPWCRFHAVWAIAKGRKVKCGVGAPLMSILSVPTSGSDMIDLLDSAANGSFGLVSVVAGDDGNAGEVAAGR